MVKILSHDHKEAISKGVLRYYDKVGRNGTLNKDGYREFNFKIGRQYEHRAIVEQHIGRKLLPYEIIHHKNGNKLDNRIENLEIMTRDEHAKLHLSNKFLKARIGISPSNKTKQDKIDKVIEMKKQGSCLYDIKKATGISYTTIIKYRHLYNNKLINDR